MCLFCFGIIEKALTRQCAHFSFHIFWINGEKLIEFRAIFVVGN